MAILSRRAILGSGVAGGILTAAAAVAADGTFGNPDQPAEGAVNVTNPKALTTRGLRTRPPTGPRSLTPRQPTSMACRNFGLHSIYAEAVQNGGWARQIRMMTSKFRRRSPASTCGSAQAASASCIGTSSNGPS